MISLLCPSQLTRCCDLKLNKTKVFMNVAIKAIVAIVAGRLTWNRAERCFICYFCEVTGVRDRTAREGCGSSRYGLNLASAMMGISVR